MSELHATSGFPRTRWSLVTAAAKLDDSCLLDELCALYLPVIRACVRRFAHAEPDAQDLTQSVFAHILQRKVLARATPDRGPFRKWLILKIRTVISRERRRARALKRGGGAIMLSLDVGAVERRRALEPVDPRSPNRDYVRRQKTELHQRVMAELERCYASRGKQQQFQRLKPFIDGRELPYSALAIELGISAGTLRKQVFDMKECYVALVRADFKCRGVKPADIDNEIRNLLDE